MAVELEIAKRLNLIRSSPGFVLKDIGTEGRQQVMSLAKIPSNSGVYWVIGTTKLKTGCELESVFIVDTNGGGSLLNVYWLIDEQWHRHDDADVLTALRLDKSDVFPFNWSYSVPLEHDLYL